MDPTVATRHARLIGSLREGGPRQREVLRWGYPRLNFRRAQTDGCPGAKLVAASEPREYFRGGRAEGTMPGHVFGKRGRDNTGLLVRQPLLSVERAATLARPAPGRHLGARKQIPNGRNRSDVVECQFAIPDRDAGVKQCVGQREEQLDVSVEVEVIAPRYPLRQLGPVTRGCLAAWPIAPVLGDALGRVVELSADVEQILSLAGVARVGVH